MSKKAQKAPFCGENGAFFRQKRAEIGVHVYCRVKMIDRVTYSKYSNYINSNFSAGPF
jgi:hypothetical protein